MTCTKCNNSIPEGVAACENCGEEIVTAAETSAEVSAVPEEAAEAVAAPQTEETTADEQTAEFADPSFSEPPKKAKKTGKIAAAVVALALVLALVVGFATNAFEPVKGFAIKTFGSDTAYLRYVGERAFDSAVEASASYSDASALNAVTEAEGFYESEVKLNLGSDLMLLLQLAMPETDLSWLDGLVVKVDAGMQGNLQAINATLNVSETEVVEINTVLDLTSQDVYFALPDLNDGYLKIPAESYTDGVDVTANGVTETISYEELAAVLPTDKELGDMFNKYIDVIYEGLDNVTSYNEVLTIYNISEELTVLEIKLSDKDVAEITEAVLNLAKTDTELESLIKNLQPLLEDAGAVAAGTDAYAEVVKALDKALAEVSATKETADETDSYSLKTYVNATHDIVGCAALTDGVEDLFAGMTTNENSFAVQMRASSLIISGTGVVTDDVASGDFNVVADGAQALTVKVSDFDLESLEDGCLNGTVLIIPAAESEESADALTSMLAPSIEIKFTDSKDATLIDINLLVNEEILAGISMSMKPVKGEDIALPSQDKVVDGTDYDALSAWASSIDWSKLTQSLTDAGLPEEIVSAVESLIYGEVPIV